MTERHVSDDRLIEICVSGGVLPAESAHLSACSKCELRRLSVVDILGELDSAASVEAEAAFPPERLERQQARIFQRIEQDGRPGRLITFPAAPAASVSLLRSRPHVRWAAGAAAAAFVVGLLTGHLAHDLPIRPDPPAPQIVANESDAAPLRAVSTTFSEDEFLGQIELAAGSNGPAALRALDAMTPRAWEVR